MKISSSMLSVIVISLTLHIFPLHLTTFDYFVDNFHHFECYGKKFFTISLLFHLPYPSALLSNFILIGSMVFTIQPENVMNWAVDTDFFYFHYIIWKKMSYKKWALGQHWHQFLFFLIGDSFLWRKIGKRHPTIVSKEIIPILMLSTPFIVIIFNHLWFQNNGMTLRVSK